MNPLEKSASSPLILIPARMASTRLPGKPMADIAGKPMIVRMLEIAHKAAVGDVAVACDGKEIAAAVCAAGGNAILTDPDLPSGSDRIWQAYERLGGAHDIIVNLQGDMPTLDPALIRQVLLLLENPAVDIATLAAAIHNESEKTDPAVVKPVISFHESARSHTQSGRALYFTRCTAPHGATTLYHHIGLYAYRRAALERFVRLAPSPLEKAEKLEQLRALEAGMHIAVGIVDTVPLGVDTPETLEKARKHYEQHPHL